VTRGKLKWITVFIRWLEKAGLQRDAVRSRKVAQLPPLPPPRLLPGGAYKFGGGTARAEVQRLHGALLPQLSKTNLPSLRKNQCRRRSLFVTQFMVALTASTLETSGRDMTKESLPLAICALIFFTPTARTTCAQAPSRIDPMVVPEIAVQNEDYAKARKRFHTTLIKKGPAPEQVCTPTKPPLGVSKIEFPSGPLRFKAWVSRPPAGHQRKSSAVLFLHGGFCFDFSDWQVTQAFRDAGFIVMIPVLRGEDGQPGNFTMFYDEVDDAVNAAAYLLKQFYVDPDQLYVAGHSTGGTLTMLTAMTFPHFRAAASFSGSPDAVGYTRHAVAIGADVPFNYRDPMELQLRSARVYAASFKCPVRIYYGADETHFALSSQPTAKLAREHGLDVQAIAVDGGHNSALDAEIRMAIDFFRQASKGGE